ncbi:MAG: FkbM family methyltransferase [Verrucomicrobia bacterium]|nr:FkbM family methyltransferase [Verrucomicrobiota bacterium]
MADKEYYAEERRLFTALREAGLAPKIIFDVGSSHAGWSTVTHAIFPDAEFHLFEPLIDFKAYYQEHSSHALQHHPNFRLHKLALGARDGETTLISDEAGFSASILADQPFGDLTERRTVPLRRLDSLVAEGVIRCPDILKMDVQGAEMMILEGLGQHLQTVKLIQSEAWFDRGYGSATPLFHELKTFLEERGFYLLELGEMFYSPEHRLYAFDSFFLHTSLAEIIGAKVLSQCLTRPT